jgi:hypothetical protein
MGPQPDAIQHPQPEKQTMTSSRTANLVWGTLVALVLCLLAIPVSAAFGAPEGAYATIGQIAMAIGGGGGIGSVAMGIRHLGAKHPPGASQP